MSDEHEIAVSEPTAVWNRARLEKRRAELSEGLESIKAQFQRAYSMQEGAIQMVDAMLAELDAPLEDPAAEEKKNRAAHRRVARAQKRKGLPEAEVEVNTNGVAETG